MNGDSKRPKGGELNDKEAEEGERSVESKGDDQFMNGKAMQLY